MIKKVFPKLTDVQTLAIIHIGLALSFPFLVGALMFGCSEALEERPGDLGKKANDQEVLADLGEAIQSGHIDQAKPTEYSHYEYNYRVEVGAVIKQDDRFRIFQGIDPNNTSKWIFSDQIISYDTGGNETGNTGPREVVYIHSPSNSVNPTNVEKLNALLNPNNENTRTATFYNYSKSVYFTSPPKAVADRPGCEGLHNCQIRVVELKFDSVYFDEDGNFSRKENHVWKFSTSIPQLFDINENVAPGPIYPIVSGCVGGLIFIEADDRYYYVNQCQVLRDFHLEND